VLFPEVFRSSSSNSCSAISPRSPWRRRKYRGRRRRRNRKRRRRRGRRRGRSRGGGGEEGEEEEGDVEEGEVEEDTEEEETEELGDILEIISEIISEMIEGFDDGMESWLTLVSAGVGVLLNTLMGDKLRTGVSWLALFSATADLGQPQGSAHWPMPDALVGVVVGIHF
jgi:hypothetical protein